MIDHFLALFLGKTSGFSSVNLVEGYTSKKESLKCYCDVNQNGVLFTLTFGSVPHALLTEFRLIFRTPLQKGNHSLEADDRTVAKFETTALFSYAFC